MNLGIYIHIPFCRSKCRYCSFVSLPDSDALIERYFKALMREICPIRQDAKGTPRRVDTIYFGGGTPSLVPAEHLADLMATCRSTFDVSVDCEISMEANPGTLEAAKLSLYREIGINRVSLGAQSFSADELSIIGRIHNPGQIHDSVELLQTGGLCNFNLDLMLGLPGQTASGWRRNLEEAISLAPSHISVYMLELDPKVPLYRTIGAGACRMPEEDAVADWYLATIEYLATEGFDQYEISNFSRPGCECRHNLKYWRRHPVLAFGVSGHSFDGSSRYANPDDMGDYLDSVEAGRNPSELQIPGSTESEFEETMFLGLRLTSGLDWNTIRMTREAARLVKQEASIRDLVELGLLEWQGTRVRLTRRGMLLSNEVFQRFMREAQTNADRPATKIRLGREG